MTELSTPPMRPERPALRIGILLADHFTLSAFAVFVDHLRLAADEGDRSRQLRIRWSIMSHRNDPIRSSCGMLVVPTTGLLPTEELDYLVVVGGLLHAGPQFDETLLRYLRTAAGSGTPLIGICTGSFILCRAGLMRAHRSCVSWYHYQDFRETFPDHDVVADRLFVRDGPRITCAGGAGAGALATYLIERHLGRAVAEKASQVLLFDRQRSGAEAQPHPPLAATATDPRLRRALLLMEQNLSHPIPVNAIAQQLGMSVRQFERLCRGQLGMTPASQYRQLRLHYGHWLLQNTDRSVTDIAIETGFADCAHFSRQFKDAYGLPPSSRRMQPEHAAGDAACARVYGPGTSTTAA